MLCSLPFVRWDVIRDWPSHARDVWIWEVSINRARDCLRRRATLTRLLSLLPRPVPVPRPDRIADRLVALRLVRDLEPVEQRLFIPLVPVGLQRQGAGELVGPPLRCGSTQQAAPGKREASPPCAHQLGHQPAALTRHAALPSGGKRGALRR